MKNARKLVVVTGANRGIGFALVDKLCQTHPSFKIIMTARDISLGEQAREKIISRYPNAQNNLILQKLDIKDPLDHNNLFTLIQSKFQGLDVLVNNAGVSESSKGASETFEVTMKTNYHSTVDLTEKLLPLLNDEGKIIMVSSILGKLAKQGPAIQEFLGNPLTITQINEKLKEFEENFEKKTHAKLGFSPFLYNNSKAFLNAYVRWILANKMKASKSCFTIHPGWCKTGLSGNTGPKTAEEGTKTALYLIELDPEKSKELNGKYLDDETNVINF